MENSSQVLLVLSRTGELVDARRTMDLWSAAPHEMIGKYNIMEDPNYVGMKRFLEKLTAGEEVLFPDHDYDPSTAGYRGIRRKLSSKGFPVPAENGEPSELVVLQHEDITAECRAEELYETLFDEAAWGIFRTTLDGRLISGNRALTAMLGRDLSEAESGRPNIRDLYVDEGARERFLAQLIEQGWVEGFEARFYRKDRSVMWGSIIARITQDENGTEVIVGSLTDVTKAREAEQQYRSLYENAFEGIFRVTPEGRFTDANPALLNIMGYGSFSELGDGITSIARQCFADRREWASVVRALREEGMVKGIKVRWVRRDGRKIWVSVAAREAYDDAGRLSHYEGTLVDISEQVHSENVSNALYRISTAVNETRNLDDLYLLIHAELRTRMNAENFFIALLEEEKDRLVFPYFADEKDVFMEICGISDPDVLSMTLKVIREGRPLFAKKEKILEMAGGKAGVVGTVPEVWLGVPLRVGGELIGAMAVQDYRDPDCLTGRDVGLMVAIADQTASAIERKMDRESLRKSEEEYRSLFENAADGFFRADAEGRITKANAALASLFGFQSPEALSESGVNIIDLMEQSEDRFAFRQGLALNGEVPRMELEMSVKGGPLWVCVAARSVPDADGVLSNFDGVVTDIGERRKKEEAERAKEAAEASNRAKSEFLAAMSHEIRTPMNAILGMADLLTRSGLDERQKEFVDIFRTAGESLMEVLNDILDLSKVEAGRMVVESIPFDLREVMDKTCRVMQTKAFEKNLDFSCDVSDAVPERLVGDPTRLKQVLVNLIGNAVKFTQEGGVFVSVNTAGERGKEELLVFRVVDTGIGIEQGDRERIFESFSQADTSTTRKFGGTGLGLAISRRLVRLMRGEIRVEPRDGGGCVFVFVLPLKPDDEPGAGGIPIEPRYRRVVDAEKISAMDILVVDDNAGNRALIKAYLDETSCRVEEAVNGIEALDKVRKGYFDLIFMDIEMPEMDGYRTIAAIRKWEKAKGWNPVPICALTAHAFEENRQKCFDAGCTLFLSKPVRMEDVLEAVVRAGDGRSCVIDLEPVYKDSEEVVSEPAVDRGPHAEPEESGDDRIVVRVPKRIERLIPLFMETTEKDAADMEAALMDDDLDTVRRLGHSLKGAGVNYGFDLLGEIGRKIEVAADEGDGTGAAECIALLRRTLDRLEIEIDEK